MTVALPAGAAEIITRKKSLYCRLADTNDWDKIDQVLAPDLTFTAEDAEGKVININNTDYVFKSRADWVAYFSTIFASLQTMHQVGYPELEAVAPDEVKATFGVTYLVGTKEADKGVHGTGAGHYYETWKLKDGDWFIQTVKFVRIYWKEMIL
ncbi:hypothetical protein TARUN_8879 [Trichoderma arundinaceum]|uniref:SnoaL-like domain-containing protein n=1 Tax=Trichoderma arundinaceum TaxID=490622 RepID=A0A395NC33_TRIAR|nr:hypothetical protein TARUN_8879 [Trichoderma arundinaceum]